MQPWASLDGLDAFAHRIGPFAGAPFLSAVERHGGADTTPTVTRTEGGAVALVLDAGIVRFAGPSHLTDYHSPLGNDPSDALVEGLASFAGYPFRLDSMPEEVRDAVTDALADHVEGLSSSDDESTAVLSLPATYDDWLMSIGKKERHEVRRKRRRFEEMFGEVSVVTSGKEAIDSFCSMHRESAGDKGQFMTATMQRFFEDLLETAGATIHSLVCGGRVRASAFGFETEDGYFFYNSAYDQDAAMASPGVVLFSSMIEQQIDRGAGVFDFLKGSETYKYRHGATERRLYVVQGVMP